MYIFMCECLCVYVCVYAHACRKKGREREEEKFAAFSTFFNILPIYVHIDYFPTICRCKYYQMKAPHTGH